MKKPRNRRRPRVGRVSYYPHHGGWHLYYQQDGQTVRKRVADTEEQAARLAAQINAQLVSGAPTLLTFEPISVPALRQSFLEHHEHVLRSSLATVNRYRTATQHLENFAAETCPTLSAHEISIDRFIRYLRTLRVSPKRTLDYHRKMEAAGLTDPYQVLEAPPENASRWKLDG